MDCLTFYIRGICVFNIFKKQAPLELSIEFTSPQMLHPNSDEITVADLSFILEKKYHLLEKFGELYQDKICERFATLSLRSLERSKDFTIDKKQILRVLEQDIQEWWREYIVEAQHGLTTKASEQRGSEPFIDTGAYFRNIRVILNI